MGVKGGNDMLKKEVAINWLELFNDSIQKNSAYLNELDTPIGDGDHGANMARGMTAVVDKLTTEESTDAADVFKVAAMQLLAKVGGASGPLYWSAFSGIAKGLAKGDSLADSLQVGLDEVKKRGKSDVGEKTMIDVWAPVVMALEKGTSVTDEMIDGFVQATKEIQATKGRASYLGERSLGHIDPGACSSGLFFKAMIQSGAMKA